jgi:hypothetical protein
MNVFHNLVLSLVLVALIIGKGYLALEG